MKPLKPSPDSPFSTLSLRAASVTDAAALAAECEDRDGDAVTAAFDIVRHQNDLAASARA